MAGWQNFQNWWNRAVWGGAGADVKTAPGQARGLVPFFRRIFGGWPGAEAARKTPAGRELEEERVNSGPSGIVLPAFLPWFGDQVGETAEMRRAYRQMVTDSHVKSAFLGKLLAVAALDLKVAPADKTNRRDQEVADFVRWSLTDRLEGGIPGLVWSVIGHALIDGHSVCEKVLEYEDRGRYGGKVVLNSLKPKDVGNDVVLLTDQWRNVVGVQGLRYNAGEVFHPSQFVIYQHLSLFDSPVGTSDFRAAYRPWWIKDTAWKLRSVLMERRATPLLFGQWKTSSQKDGLEKALGLAKSLGWVSAPDDVKLQAIEMAGSADSIFDSAIKALCHEIVLSIQGAILQQLEGTTADGAGNSQVHRSTADLFVWHLAETMRTVLCGRRSGIVRDLVDLNYVVSEYPTVKLGAVDVNELSQRWQYVQGLHQAGLDLSKEQLYNDFDMQPPKNKDDALPGQPPPSAGGQGPGGGGGQPPGGAPPFAEDRIDILAPGPNGNGKRKPASGGAGATPFRFSEAWRDYVGN